MTSLTILLFLNTLAQSNSDHLCQAAYSGKTHVLRQLLSEGISPNDTDSSGKTPIMYAAQMSHLDAVEVLLKFAAEVNSVDRKGLTPLHFSCIPTLKLDKNPPGQRRQDVSVWERKLKIAQLLLQAGADMLRRDHYGNQPIMYAVIYGKLNLVQLFLDHGANINVQNNQGLTPLMYATLFNHEALLPIILRNGADVNLVNCDGKTASDMAREKGYDHLLAILDSFKKN